MNAVRHDQLCEGVNCSCAIRQELTNAFPGDARRDDLLDAFTRSYVASALWSSNGDDGEPLDRTCDLSDFSTDALASVVRDCVRFQRENAEALDTIPDRRGRDVPDIAGFLFWLNRNGHGSGFWDEDRIPEPARKHLSDASHAFGPSDLSVGDDGKLYVSPKEGKQ